MKTMSLKNGGDSVKKMPGELLVYQYHLHSSITLFSYQEKTVNYSLCSLKKESKGAKIRNRYNQVPHLTQDTNGKVTKSQLDTTNVSQEVSFFQADDYKAQINRRLQRHKKHKIEKT